MTVQGQDEGDLPGSVAAATKDLARHAMFAMPIAYLIDEAGVIANDVSVGTDEICKLMDWAVESSPARGVNNPRPPLGASLSRTLPERSARAITCGR